MSMLQPAPLEPPLPSYTELVTRFGLLAGDAGGCAPEASGSGAFGCACSGCTHWRAFVEGRLPHEGGTHPRYEVLTREFVTALAAYLRERAAAYAPGRPLRVLEVGAGDGRLAHHLLAALRDAEHAEHAVTLTATDSGARGLHATSPCAALVQLAPCDASLLSREQPDLVLACWMPFACDWTATFRACASVREYVLIGEADDGICGLPWETWGHARPEDDAGSSGSEGDAEPRLPPYEADGFARLELPQLTRWQLCRTDERWRRRGASRSVAFRRGDA